MSRAIICGGRDFEDKAKAFAAIGYVHKRTPITFVIEGGARGADRLARQWAIAHNVPYTTVYAEWDRYGKRAGYLRNKRMRDEFSPDLVIALPGGVGTKMMIDLAKEVKLKVYEFKAESNGED